METSLLAHAGPDMVANRAQALVRAEVSKGCLPEISPVPVALEPLYAPVLDGNQWDAGQQTASWTVESPPREEEFLRLRIWVSPDQKCDWGRSETFLKQLSCVQHRIVWELIGNEHEIALQIQCHVDDHAVVRTAFASQFEQCALTPTYRSMLTVSTPGAWNHAVLRDYYPSPPYSHLLTCPEELQRSPYAAVVAALASIPAPAFGAYQVVFMPVAVGHNWHSNVEALLDLEFRIKQIVQMGNPQRLPQQPPSAALTQMSKDLVIKSHNDKPFYAASLRLCIINGGDRSPDLLRSLAAVTGLVQHGGRPLNALEMQQYRQRVSPEDISRMFGMGLTHRCGFLVNSMELTSLVHVPPPALSAHLSDVVRPLETLGPEGIILAGTQIGDCVQANVSRPVCIPDNLRTRHVHLIGRPGMGKSSAMEHMVLHDIARGQGVAVLDPHGLLVQRLLALIPPEHADRVIYFDPGDPRWVPIWNPLHCRSSLPLGRIANDLVGAFKSFITGWGHRLEHLLRQAVLGALHLPEGSLLDVWNLLRQRSGEGDELRAQVLNVVDNELVRLFWQEDFAKYTSADLSPPKHKLSSLLTAGTVSYMLSQGASSFDFLNIMDTGKILLMDLSGTGSEVREILGCLVMSLLHLTALGRGGGATQTRRPFHIYADEAHRFMTHSLEDLIAETRKFDVSLTLAHQYLAQFTTEKAEAMSAVGTTVIFNVGSGNAQRLKKDLRDLVGVDDIITLEVGQAIARIGTQVVRLRTKFPLEIPEHNSRDLIIERSHQLYCMPVEEVKRVIRSRNQRWAEPLSPLDRQNPPVAGLRGRGTQDAAGAGAVVDDSFESLAENYDRF